MCGPWRIQNLRRAGNPKPENEVGYRAVSTELKFNRNFDKLTTEYVRDRLERLDEMMADPENGQRIRYLSEQREWWEGQLPYCYRREGLLQ